MLGLTQLENGIYANDCQDVPLVSNLFYHNCSDEKLTLEITSTKNYKNIVLKSAAVNCVACKSFKTVRSVTTNLPPCDWPKFQNTAKDNLAWQNHNGAPVYFDYSRFS